jgi:hypothetical protein
MFIFIIFLNMTCNARIDVTLRRVVETFVAVEKQEILHILIVVCL